MQIKYGFKLNLLLGTFLVTSAVNADYAYSKNFRTGVELPSVEVNFAVIQELRNKEIERQKAEARRLREAQYSSQYRDMQGQQLNNAGGTNANSGNYQQYGQGYTQQQPSYVEPQQQRYTDNYNQGLQQQYQGYQQKQSNSVQTNVWKDPNIRNDRNESYGTLPPSSKLYDPEKYTSAPFTVATPKEIQENLLLPRLKPGSEPPQTNESYTLNNKVVELKSPIFEQKNVVNETYFDQPGRRQSFIKVTEVPSSNSGESSGSPKVSYYNFPKVEKKEEEYTKTILPNRVNKDVREYAEEPEELFDIPKKLPNKKSVFNDDIEVADEDEFSQYDGDEKELPDVKEVKLYEDEKELIDDVKSLPSVKKDEPKVTESLGEITSGNIDGNNNTENKTEKEESFISVVNQKVKNLFSFSGSDGSKGEANKGDKLNIKVISKNDQVSQKQPDNIKNEMREPEKVSVPQKVNEYQSPEEENKALIPVEVSELNEIVQDYSDDYTKPVYLDGVSNLSDWTVPGDVLRTLDSDIKRKPKDNLASLRMGTNIVLPNAVEVQQMNQASKEAPKPRVKPFQEEDIDVRVQKIVSPVVRKSATKEVESTPVVEKEKKKEEVSVKPVVKEPKEVKKEKVSEIKTTPVAKEIKTEKAAEIKTPVANDVKKEKVAENKVPVVKEVKKVKIQEAPNNEEKAKEKATATVSVEKKTPVVVSSQENVAKERDYDPLGDEKWNKALEQARQKAVEEQEDKAPKKVDLSKFKNLLKKDGEEEAKTELKAEANLSPSSNPEKTDEASSSETIKLESVEQKVTGQTVDSEGVLYLEDIAKTLKKNKGPNDVVINHSVLGSTSASNINVGSGILSNNIANNVTPSKVTELVGNKIVVPSSEMDLLNTTSNILATPKNDSLLKIDFNEDQLELSKSDNERINKLVDDIKGSNKKVAIVSYASSNKIENARRISLKRAIAVRSAMLEAGLTSDMVHVQAAGVAEKKQDENSVKISFAN